MGTRARAIIAASVAGALVLAAPELIAQAGSLRVTVPSPTAASLGKFGDMPVSFHTGVPDITVPLFTARGRTLELPITLKYHASGIRVEEIGGWAGLGWTLEAGGVITRTVRGLADDAGSAGYYSSGHIFWNSVNWPHPPTSLLDSIRNEWVDSEPDQFFYSFAGRSGQIVIGPASTSTTLKEHRAIPHQRLRIQPLFAGGAITSWTITSEDGTRYTFAATETSADFTTVNGSFGSHYGQSYTSAWHLTEIRSPGGDVITLSYTPYTVRHRLTTYGESFHQSSGPACNVSSRSIANEHETTAQKLASITAAAHTVTFTAGAALRTDALAPNGAQQEPRLDRITVATPGGTVLRVFQLEHDYFPGNRLRLKQVAEKDSNGVSLPPYTFTYDGQTLPALTSTSQDHWGYFNGQSNTTLLPAIHISGTIVPGANREPDSVKMRAGTLTKVTYPTGGYDEFVYEANDYGAIGGSGQAPIGDGPEQSRFIQADPSQPDASAQFTVGGTDSSVVTIDIQQDPSSGCGSLWPPCPFTELKRGTTSLGKWYSADSLFQRTLAPGTYTILASENGTGGWASIEVGWRDRGVVKKKLAGGVRVAEIRSADAMGGVKIRRYRYTLRSDTTKSSGVVNEEPSYTFWYSSPQCSYLSRSARSLMPLGGGSPVGYREVTVLHGATGEHGRTRHAFRSVLDVSDVPPSNLAAWPHSPWTSFEWMRGQRLASEEYNAAGQIQRRDAATHGFTGAQQRFRGLSIHDLSAGGMGSEYYYNEYEVISGWAYQSSDTTAVYDTTGTTSFATARTYAYGNPAHLQLTEVTETNSDGVQRITRMKYPADFAVGSGNAEATALAAMQDTAHIHSPVIERWTIRRAGGTDSVVQASLSTFKGYASAQYLPYQQFILNSPSGLTNFSPASVTGGVFGKDSRYLLQETADAYDAHGRITQLTDARGNATAYQYGGNPNSAFLTKVTQIWSGGPDLVTDIAYDTDGFVASVKDEGGTFRYFTYDLFGRLRQIKNHGGTVVKAIGYTYSRTSPSWTFNPASPNAVVDTLFLQQSPTPKSVVSTEFLDGLGRPIQTVVQDGASYVVTATQYDAMGRPWRNWKPYTRSTAGYDASFAANATSFYNSYHAVSTAKPFVETSYRTDALARVTQVTPPYIGTSPTAFTLYAYGVDAAPKHQYTEITDESGKKQRSYADVFGNAVKMILGFGSAEATTTLFASNVVGQRLQATDPRGLATTYAIDTRGLLTSKTGPDAGTVSHKYDKAGNLRYAQDANEATAGQVQFTTYDVFNRPLTSGQGAATFSALDPDAGSPPALETTQSNWLVVRAYDAKPSTGGFPWSLFSAEITPLTLSGTSGRLAAVASKSNGAWQATLFSYDADGRVATRYTYTQANGGASVLGALNATVTYVRDLRDAVTERWLTVGSNTFNHWYEFDNRGLLWKVFASTGSTKPGSADATYSYRPSGQMQDRQFQGGPLVPLRYDMREQVEKIGDPAGTSYPFSARYAYHPNGTVSEAEFYSAGSPAVAKRYRYQFPTYDALNRLNNADFSTWSGSSWTSTLAHDLAGISYDASGNLTALQRYRETATLVDNLSYAYPGSSNRLSSVTDAVGGTAESWDAETGSFTYDANGNVLTSAAPYSITAVAYDDRNLPLSLTRAGTTTAYRYDDAGQRIAKQVGGGDTEVYVLDRSTSLGVVTVNGSGTPTTWHFNVLAGDRVIGRQPNVGNRSYYHTDLLSSTRSVVQGTTVVESYDFEPWGLLMPGRTLGSGTKEGFTGKEHDAETGLEYFGARYYMPALGRWAGIDPLAAKHPEWSSYNYVLNNPLVLIDPDGRQVRADLGDFSPFGPYGDYRIGADGRVEANREKQQAEATGALIALSLLPFGTLFEGALSTAIDAASGAFGFRRAALNFLPGPGTGKLDDIAEVARSTRKLGHDAALRSAGKLGTALDDLAEAAKVLDKGGELTRAGRQLEKHGSRPGSAFPRATGNAAAKNAAGQEIVEDIITNPGSRTVVLTSGRFKGGFDIYAPDGRGVRYNSQAGFVGFLEPPRK
jgi:RHS repeat-associated protein